MEEHFKLRINSATARKFLERNTNNRTISRRHVERLKLDMKCGRWVYTAAPICFAVDGRLLDGQHRLTALAEMESEKGFDFLVVHGLSDVSQVHMDKGMKRPVAAQLQLSGHTFSTRLAAAVRLFMVWDQDLLFTARGDTNITDAMIQEWTSMNPGLVESLETFYPLSRKLECPDCVPNAMAITAMEYRFENDFREFLESMVSLVGLRPGDPRLALRNQLMHFRAKSTRMHNREFLGYFVKTWNHHFAGDSRTLIKTPVGGWKASDLVMNYPEFEDGK